MAIKVWFCLLWGLEWILGVNLLLYSCVWTSAELIGPQQGRISGTSVWNVVFKLWLVARTNVR